jgi:hypothetical protein
MCLRSDSKTDQRDPHLRIRTSARSGRLSHGVRRHVYKLYARRGPVYVVESSRYFQQKNIGERIIVFEWADRSKQTPDEIILPFFQDRESLAMLSSRSDEGVSLVSEWNHLCRASTTCWRNSVSDAMPHSALSVCIQHYLTASILRVVQTAKRASESASECLVRIRLR